MVILGSLIHVRYLYHYSLVTLHGMDWCCVFLYIWYIDIYMAADSCDICKQYIIYGCKCLCVCRYFNQGTMNEGVVPKCLIRQRNVLCPHTPLKTNMSPEKWWWEDYSALKWSFFRWHSLILEEVSVKLPKHIGYDSNFILGDQKVITTILAAVNLGGSWILNRWPFYFKEKQKHEKQAYVHSFLCQVSLLTSNFSHISLKNTWPLGNCWIMIPPDLLRLCGKWSF